MSAVYFVSDCFDSSVDVIACVSVSRLWVSEASAVVTDLDSVDIVVPRLVHDALSEVLVNRATSVGCCVGIEISVVRAASVMMWVDANGPAWWYSDACKTLPVFTECVA